MPLISISTQRYLFNLPENFAGLEPWERATSDKKLHVKERTGLCWSISLFSRMIHSCDGVIIGKVPKTFVFAICVEFSHGLGARGSSNGMN